MDSSPDWKRIYRQAALVHTAVVVSIFLYVIILEVLKSVLHPMPRLAGRGSVQGLRYLFYGLAIGVVVVVRFVNRRALGARPAESFEEFLHRLAHAAVLTSILCEAPALLGLVLVFFVGASIDFYYLVFVSLFLAFLYYPRSRSWAEIMGERFPRRDV